MNDANVQIGTKYTEEQIRILAPSAIALADAADVRERCKREINKERMSGTARVREHYMIRDAYKNAKRKFRLSLAKYIEVKKGL